MLNCLVMLLIRKIDFIRGKTLVKLFRYVVNDVVDNNGNDNNNDDNAIIIDVTN